MHRRLNMDVGKGEKQIFGRGDEAVLRSPQKLFFTDGKLRMGMRSQRNGCKFEFLSFT